MPRPTKMPNHVSFTEDIAVAVTMDASPAVEPTEISRPPEMTTTVCTITSTPSTEIATPMLSKFEGRKKYGD